VWYGSEETGFAHIYTVSADGTGKRALTSGDWEVLSARIPDGWDRFLLRTNERSPHDQHPWSMAFDGSDRTQILEGPGQFNATPSPDGSRLAVVHSRSNQPPELYLSDSAPGSSLERVTVSPTEEWSSFDWLDPEIIRFEARDGTEVPARIYRPSDMGVPANGAGVVFVHGAGYLQNVHNWWSNYYREYMFHHFLAAQGYTIIDIDYRGSAGYGRDWRTAIYRHMGGWDLSDQVDGVSYLVSEEGVDPDRIGLYGGSYGGFITLMALFTEPDVFQAGAALRPVTDWAHYNHGYTARILNLPHEDEESYRRSSPIYFAEGFEGDLLIAHGMYDTNVHYSDVVRLAQRLIELGKENWELASYPVENHGFVEPTSWTDEYRRIYELFERVIGADAGSATQGEGG
jgi:dipeptidyl aminopeptidase/acylaminoacyl peptidase